MEKCLLFLVSLRIFVMPISYIKQYQHVTEKLRNGEILRNKFVKHYTSLGIATSINSSY